MRSFGERIRQHFEYQYVAEENAAQSASFSFASAFPDGGGDTDLSNIVSNALGGGLTPSAA